MAATIDAGSAEETVREIFAAEFGDIEIARILIRDDVSWDGLPLRRIDLIVEDGAIDLDSSRIPQFLSHVIDALQKTGDEAFPLFSFISAHEFQQARRAS